MPDLSEKTVLITGASGGIGSAIARRLHRSGASIIATGTRQEALESLIAELKRHAFAEPADLSDPEAVSALVSRVEERSGGIDILVNNAGMNRDMLAMRLKDEDWDSVLEVNLGAVFRLSRAVLRGMTRKRAGRIINISSVVAKTGNIGQANYIASKSGLEGLTRALAHETAPRGITVNCIAPGFIVTPMTEKLPETLRQQFLARIPASRFGAPEDIAAAVEFLAGPDAGYITGQILHINGGMAM